MLNTSPRRLAISKWLKDNNPGEFYESLKLQKYLFFYELFSKVEGDEYSLEYLKGYENGPVFSEVYGDYTYRKEEFEPRLDEVSTEDVNCTLAKKAGFLASILSKEELSEITHELNIWKSKEEKIFSDQKHISLSEVDFDTRDEEIINELKDLYSSEFIDTVNIVKIKKKNFLLDDLDFSRLNDQHKDVLEMLAEEDLDNPVYITIGEEGELLVD